jgi:hypothetical protein
MRDRSSTRGRNVTRNRSATRIVGILIGLAVLSPRLAAAAEPAASPECKSAGVTISFASGSTEIDTNGRGALAGVATWLQNGDRRTVRLEASADRRGGATGNQRLSERRAKAAKDFLVDRGISPDRIMAFGHGEEDQPRPGIDARVVVVTACDVPAEVSAETPPAPEPTPVEQPAPAAPPPAPPAPPPPPVAPMPLPYTPIAVVPPPEPASALRPPSKIGMEATVGAGAIGFIDESARNATQTGASWDARLMVGSRLPIALEGAYIGSVQNIQALGLNTDSLLLGNGVEGTVRVNLTRARVQPYLFGGVGWTHYQLTNTVANTSSISDKDDIGTLPLGAGLSARVGRAVILDVRGTYRATFADDMMKATSLNGNSSSMQTWNAAGRVGFEF